MLGDSVARMIASLRDLDDEDVEALAAILSPEAGELIRQSVQLLREVRGKPLDEILLPAIDEYWDKALRKQVEVKLNELAAP